MAGDRLREYPVEIDPFLDFEATNMHFGTGSCTYGITEMKASFEKTLVYMWQQKEGDEVIDTPRGFGKKCENNLIVCGYKVEPSGFFGIFKSPRIKVLREEEREKVRSELLKIISRTNPELKIEDIIFWD